MICLEMGLTFATGLRMNLSMMTPVKNAVMIESSATAHMFQPRLAMAMAAT